MNDCNMYCTTCWESVSCGTCSHSDPKGSLVRGRWMCRMCNHHEKNKRHNSAQAQEALHRAIIEDENGEVGDSAPGSPRHHLAVAESPSSLPSEEPIDVHEDDDYVDAECSEQDDCIAPLNAAMLRPKSGAAGAAVSNSPAHVLIVLDTSKSMESVDVLSATATVAGAGSAAISRLDAALSCAADFVQAHARCNPFDKFSLILFSEQSDVVVESVDSAELLLAIGAVSPHAAHGTSYSAALRAVRGALCRQRRHRGGGEGSHVVFLSDGRPGDTKAALNFFQRELLQEGFSMHLHGIGFGASVQSFAPLQQLACLSGGTFALSACSVRDLRNAFSSVSSSISSLSSAVLVGGNEDRATERKQRVVEYELPELGVFGRNGTMRFVASRTTLKYNGTCFQENEWPSREVTRRRLPYMRGGMRLVYGFQDADAVAGEGNWMVSKHSRFVDASFNSRQVVETHVKSTAVARHFAARFNQSVRQLKHDSAAVFFVPCFVYEVDRVATAARFGKDVALVDAFFTAEQYLPGAFLKYTSNSGYVCEDFVRHHELVQAFLHFSFVASGEKLLVSDLQGVVRDKEVLLTDPQVLSCERTFGPGDLGASGLCACLASHRCGSTCRALGLKPVSTSLLSRLGQHGAPRHQLRRASRGARHGGASDGSLSGISAGWERLSSQPDASGSEWEQVSMNSPLEYQLSDGVQSSRCSASSWNLLEV